MIQSTRLPKELMKKNRGVGPVVEKTTIEGVDEIQHLYVEPWTSIVKHGHDDQWEVWVFLPIKKAFVCLKGEEHELVNHSGTCKVLMAIKGHKDYSFEDLAGVFKKWGFSVEHGSPIFNS